MGHSRAKLYDGVNRYYVVLPDGQRYGPATPPHLADWVLEGRVLPDTVLEDAQTGQRSYARQIPGLPFGAVGSPQPLPYGQAPTPTYGAPVPDPYAPYGSPQQTGMSQPYGPGQAQPQPYPYQDYGRPPSSGLSAVSFVLSLVSALMCFGPVGMVLAVVALVTAFVARSRGDRTAGCAIAVAIVTLAVTFLFALGRQMFVGG